VNRCAWIDSIKSLDGQSMTGEILAMPETLADPVHLTRIDRARNMARFYAMTIQPTLFGEMSLVRQWGRIGAYGHKMIQTFGAAEDAVHAMRRLERIKRRRGYR